MGMTITADKVRVYRNDNGNYPRYSIGISSKNKDGDWVMGYMECKFKKGVELQDRDEIKINNSFFIVEEYQDKKYIKIMVTDFSPVGDNFMEVPDGADLTIPFV